MLNINQRADHYLAPHSRHRQLCVSRSRRSFLAAAALLPFYPLYAHASHPKTVHFLGCREGVDSATLQKFGHQADVTVQADRYAGAAQFVAKFLGSEPRYDVAMAPDDSISHLLHTELLRTLDRSLIQNAGLLDPAIPLPPYDPERNYSLPYIWETLGIGYRKAAFSNAPDSWGLLLESDKHAGRIALLAEGLTVLRTAQKYLGYSINSSTPEVVSKATQLLTIQKPRIKAFTNTPAKLLLSGDTDLVMIWSGDFQKQLRESGNFGFAAPAEGTTVKQKLLCIPKHAADPVMAHRLINFLMDKDIAATLAKRFHYATTNHAAAELLGEEYKINPALSPPGTVLKLSECRDFTHDAAQNKLFKSAWDKIMGR